MALDRRQGPDRSRRVDRHRAGRWLPRAPAQLDSPRRPQCLKVKLRGDDFKWDYDRLAQVGQLAIEENVDWLTADFNCTVHDPAYVNAILDRLVIDYPRTYGMLLYVEQPFPYDLEAHRIDVHSVCAKPLFMDESVTTGDFMRAGPRARLVGGGAEDLQDADRSDPLPLSSQAVLASSRKPRKQVMSSQVQVRTFEQKLTKETKKSKGGGGCRNLDDRPRAIVVALTAVNSDCFSRFVTFDSLLTFIRHALFLSRPTDAHRGP